MSSDWEWSSPFNIGSKRTDMQKLVVYHREDASLCRMFSLTCRLDKKTNQVRVMIIPPFTFTNKTPFNVYFTFPNRVEVEYSGCKVLPHDTKSLFFLPDDEVVKLRLDEYNCWSKALPLRRLTANSVRVTKRDPSAAVVSVPFWTILPCILIVEETCRLSGPMVQEPATQLCVGRKWRHWRWWRTR